MECLNVCTECFGAPLWAVAAAFVLYYLLMAVADAIPETWVVNVGPLPIPAGRIVHVFAGNLRRALRKTPAGSKLPLELPKP